MSTEKSEGFTVSLNGKVIATYPLEAHDSASGKTVVVGTSHGNGPTIGQYDGKPIMIGFNAYVRK